MSRWADYPKDRLPDEPMGRWTDYPTDRLLNRPVVLEIVEGAAHQVGQL